MKKLFMLLLSLILLSTIVYAYDYTFSYEEGIHIVRPDSSYMTNYAIPEYISVEDMTFIACTESEVPLKLSIVCLDNNNFEEITSYEWSKGKNCEVGSVNLDSFVCENALLQAEYIVGDENNKVTKRVKINKLTGVVERLIDAQYNDGGWREPLDTALGIWALSKYPEIFDYEIDLAQKWLKDNRNDDQKCWPKAPCQLELTANMLGMLSQSGLEDDYRIINDGTNLLEERQLYYEQGDEWVIQVSGLVDDTVLTLVSYDGDVLEENFTLVNNSNEYTIEAEQGKRLIFISADNVEIDIFDANNDSVYSYQGDNLSYLIPGSCWSGNLRGEPCDTSVTAFATLSDISPAHKERAKEYMKTEISRAGVGRYYGDSSTDVTQSALYLASLYEDGLISDTDPAIEDQSGTYLYDIIQWILYTQKNDGYWGVEFSGDETDDTYTDDLADARKDQLLETMYSVYGLLNSGFNRTAESIEDAEKWTSEIEEEIGEEDGAALAAAAYILQNNARPLLTSNPGVVVIDGPETSFELLNPTPFNLDDLTYEISPSLQNMIEIEKKNSVSSFSYRKLSISKTTSASGSVDGFISILNSEIEVARIPVIIREYATLSIKFQESATVFGTSLSLPLTVSKSSHSFSCSASWDSDEIISGSSFTLSNNLPIKFKNAKTKEDVYTGSLTCVSGRATYNFPITTYISRYAARPITIESETIVINGSGTIPILVRNNLDQDLPISISLSQYSDVISISSDVYLSPGESRNVNLVVLEGASNVSGVAKLEFSALGTSESVSLIIDLLPVEKRGLGPLELIIILSFITIILVSLGFAIYKFRDEFLELLNRIPLFQSKQELKKTKSSIKDVRKKEHDQAIINMFKIMKFQNEGDNEIKKRLLASFTKEEIKTALESAGLSLPALEEDLPEKVK